MLRDLAQLFAATGFFGLLAEVIFTGFHSFFILKDKKATGKTYLWVWFVWGSGGTILITLKEALTFDHNPWWHVVLRALLFTLVIYICEFLWGWFFEHFPITKRCMWKYTDPTNHEKIHRFSWLGFIRADYFFYWFALSAAFDIYGGKIRLALNTISQL